MVWAQIPGSGARSRVSGSIHHARQCGWHASSTGRTGDAGERGGAARRASLVFPSAGARGRPVLRSVPALPSQQVGPPTHTCLVTALTPIQPAPQRTLPSDHRLCPQPLRVVGASSQDSWSLGVPAQAGRVPGLALTSDSCPRTHRGSRSRRTLPCEVGNPFFLERSVCSSHLALMLSIGLRSPNDLVDHQQGPRPSFLCGQAAPTEASRGCVPCRVSLPRSLAVTSYIREVSPKLAPQESTWRPAPLHPRGSVPRPHPLGTRPHAGPLIPGPGPHAWRLPEHRH